MLNLQEAKYKSLITAIMICSFSFLHLSYANGIKIINPHVLPYSKSATSIKDLEARIHRFVQIKTNPTQTLTNSNNSSPSLNQGDLFYLTKVWDKLDQNTKTAYLKAMEIPEDSHYYISPGNHFEVYYDSKPVNSKLQSDNISYSTTNWRLKTNQPNGIPDFVDEIAYALDSSWSMEVNRFEFVEPIPYKDLVFNSLRYKVIAEQFTGSDRNNYGFTSPTGKSNNNKGWSSIIRLNTDWASLGYDTNPEEAIQVTCAHEFFHSIQYAMTWNVVRDIELDNYPISWLEGTATSMEELAFPQVNDYIQYSNSFFNSPTKSFLNDNDTEPYTNSLLMLYIYKHSQNEPSINFLHTTLFNNYTAIIPFNQNLQITSQSIGTSWVNLLNRFHTASFFTGERSDTSQFSTDAPLMNEWSYSSNPPGQYSSINQSISPFAMGIFSQKSSINQYDSLTIFLQYKPTSHFDTSWAASAILRNNTRDSIIRITLNDSGCGLLKISNWNSYKEVVVIVTNGDPVKSRDYTVTFNNCPRTHSAGESFSISSASEDHKSKATVFVKTNDITYCDLLLTTVNKNSFFDSALTRNMLPATSLYSFFKPVGWQTNTDLQLHFTLFNPPDTSSINLYCWDSTNQSWSLVNATQTNYNDSTIFALGNLQSGVYSVFKSITLPEIAVYPNPVSIRKPVITFKANNIAALFVYDINGAIVYKYSNNTPCNTLIWNLANNSNKSVIPGLYTAILKYSETTDTKVKIAHKKILIIP